MTTLSRSLFQFEREADRLNAELQNLSTESPDIKAIFELRGYLSVIARKAALVASCLNVAAGTKAE